MMCDKWNVSSACRGCGYELLAISILATQECLRYFKYQVKCQIYLTFMYILKLDSLLHPSASHCMRPTFKTNVHAVWLHQNSISTMNKPQGDNSNWLLLPWLLKLILEWISRTSVYIHVTNVRKQSRAFTYHNNEHGHLSSTPKAGFTK